MMMTRIQSIITMLFAFIPSALLFGSAAAFLPQNSRRTWGNRFQVSTSRDPVSRTAESDDFRPLGNNLLRRSPRVETCVLASQSDAASEKALGIIIAGAPASGKGTQCEIIQAKYGVVHLSTGDMLRAAVAAGTEVGKAAQEYMDSGKLVPDEVIIGVVKDRLENDDCKQQGWLLDGFPRTEEQAKALADAGVSADCFLFLNVPDEVLVERVVGRRTDPETGKIYHMTFSPPDDEEVVARLVQRSDDTEEKVKVRLEQFHANVDAVKGSYTDISVDVDGSMAPQEVAAAVDSAISGKVAA